MVKAQSSTSMAALEVELRHLGVTLEASKGKPSRQNQTFYLWQEVHQKSGTNFN